MVQNLKTILIKVFVLVNVNMSTCVSGGKKLVFGVDKTCLRSDIFGFLFNVIIKACSEIRNTFQ